MARKKPEVVLYRDGTLRSVHDPNVTVQPVVHTDARKPLAVLTEAWLEEAGKLLGFVPSEGLVRSQTRTRTKALFLLLESLRFGDDHE